MSGIDPASRKRLRDSHVDLLRLRARLGGVEDRPFGRSQADALVRPYVPSAQWRVVVWTMAPERANWRASAGRELLVFTDSTGATTDQCAVGRLEGSSMSVRDHAL